MLAALLEAVHAVSVELAKSKRIIAIVIDDVQWCSEPDFFVLKDVMRNLPERLLLVLGLERSSPYYSDLQTMLNRYGPTEIRLVDMSSDEIKELAQLRFKLSIDDQTANYLSDNVGHPLCLVGCFQLLRQTGQDVTLESVKRILPDVVDPARCIYARLDKTEKHRVDTLCLFAHPMPLELIACMLRIPTDGLPELDQELLTSVAFVRRERDQFDFCHASLRTARCDQLPEKYLDRLRSRAAECLEETEDRFPDERMRRISLLEHLFKGREYRDALPPALELGFEAYRLSDFGATLRFAEYARICASETENRAGESAALHLSAKAYAETNRFEEALNFYRQSREIRREIEDRSGEAITLHEIGRVCERIERSDEALRYYDKSRAITREIGDLGIEAADVYQLGRLYDEAYGGAKRASSWWQELLDKLRADPLIQLVVRLRRREPSPVPAGLGCTPTATMIGGVVQAALVASGTLGEVKPSPPRSLVKIRPLLSGIRALSELTFDWEPMKSAKEYEVRLLDPRARVIRVLTSSPPLPYPEEFPRDLERGRRYDWLVVGVDKESKVIGTFKGTFWILAPEQLEELDAKVQRLRQEKLLHPWIEDLYQQYGLYDQALESYLKMIRVGKEDPKVWGYVGAINLWRTIHGELRSLKRYSLADSVQEETLRIQVALEAAIRPD